MVTSVVVGAGPNGLAAAITLARAGLDVTVVEAAQRPGGGMRSTGLTGLDQTELGLTEFGLVHDMCSAVHPMAQVSPFFQQTKLERHGLKWGWPEIELAHPLENGRAAFLYRDINLTADCFNVDGPEWLKLFEPFVERAEAVFDVALNPLLRVPRNPWLSARFGYYALQSAHGLARRFTGTEARALFAGIAAHAMRPLGSPATGGLGMALALAGHVSGWPVAQGGSQAICDAMLAELYAHGGRVECGHHVRHLPDADLVLLDTSVEDAVKIAADRLWPGMDRSLRRWRYGPGAYKIDLAVSGGIPWINPELARAGTVHLGGTLEEISAAEATVAQGRMPEKPFVLLGQQYIADPRRSNGDVLPIWLYGHVPHGWDGQARELIYNQVERYAPGFRRRIIASQVRRPADLESENPNYRGGDIAGGANNLGQLVFRPHAGLNPYSIGPGVYLCSSATPPGAGVHGMCGFNAARSAIRSLQKPRGLRKAGARAPRY